MSCSRSWRGRRSRARVRCDRRCLHHTDGLQTLTVAAPGVLANDPPCPNLAVRLGIEQGPAHGTVTLYDDGSFADVLICNTPQLDSFIYHFRAARSRGGALDGPP